MNMFVYDYGGFLFDRLFYFDSFLISIDYMFNKMSILLG